MDIPAIKLMNNKFGYPVTIHTMDEEEKMFSWRSFCHVYAKDNIFPEQNVFPPGYSIFAPYIDCFSFLHLSMFQD